MKTHATTFTQTLRAGAMAAGLLVAGPAMAAGLFDTGMSSEAGDACIAEMCLGAVVDPQPGFDDPLPDSCKESYGQDGVKAFFDIKNRRNGKFSAASTSAARKEFLDKCESGGENKRVKAQIIAVFGEVPDMPSSLF